MKIVKAANDWAKAEITSSTFFMFFGFVYLLMAIIFWQWGNTPLTNALPIPMLTAGGLLLGAGIGFYSSNKSKLASFETEYKSNPPAFIQSEIERTKQTIKTYQNIALKVFPAIIIIASILIILLANPTIRAIGIAIIAFLSVLVILDNQALKRMKTYHQQLVEVNQGM